MDWQEAPSRNPSSREISRKGRLQVEFPYLDRADVLAALEFAAAAVQERELPLAQWA